MKSCVPLLSLILVTSSSCRDSPPSADAPEPQREVTQSATESGGDELIGEPKGDGEDVGSEQTNEQTLDFDPSNPNQLGEAFFIALRSGDAELASTMVIDYDRDRFLQDMGGLSRMPPIPADLDLWVRTYDDKDAGRVSARNWEADVTFNLKLIEGRWWIVR